MQKMSEIAKFWESDYFTNGLGPPEAPPLEAPPLEAPASWITPADEADIHEVSREAARRLKSALDRQMDAWNRNMDVHDEDARQAAQRLSPALAAACGPTPTLDDKTKAGKMAAYLAILVPQDMVEELHGALTGPPPELEPPPAGEGANLVPECRRWMDSPRYGPVFQAFVNSEVSGENVAFVQAAKPLLRDFQALTTGLDQENGPELDSQAVLARAQATAQELDQQFIREGSASQINISEPSRRAWAAALLLFGRARLPGPNQEENGAALVPNLLSRDTMTAIQNALPLEAVTDLVANDSFPRFRRTPVYKAIYPRLMAEAGQ